MNVLHQIICKSARVAVVTFAVSYCATATADATAIWQSTEDALAKTVLEQSNVVSDFIKLIDDNFISTADLRLKELKVTIGNDRVPHTNVDATELRLPYRYFTNAIQSHAELEESREAALERAIDTVEFTLYHLFGHLIASDNSSDSDDIAESVSSWLMIKGFSNGGEQWFSDAQAFGRASQLLDGPLEDYWYEHSLYKSRQNTINCWILGSAPKRYANLLKPVLEPEKRTQHCIAEWNKLDSDMQSLLRDNVRSDSSLITQ